MFTFGRSGITPNTANDNWTLFADTAGDIGRVKEFGWGGEVNTGTIMRTRVVRPTTAGATITAGTPGSSDVRALTARLAVATGWTTQPVIPADGTGELYVTSWNAFGGVIRWLAAPEDQMYLTNGLLTAQISCRNAVGTALSSYNVNWDEL